MQTAIPDLFGGVGKQDEAAACGRRLGARTGATPSALMSNAVVPPSATPRLLAPGEDFPAEQS